MLTIFMNLMKFYVFYAFYAPELCCQPKLSVTGALREKFNKNIHELILGERLYRGHAANWNEVAGVLLVHLKNILYEYCVLG